MVKVIKLEKSPFECGNIASKFSKLLTNKDFERYKSHPYKEVLTELEESHFKDSIDTSYLDYKGFYLIEAIFNKYLSKTYNSIHKISSKNNKFLLEKFYLKYQIHNLLALIRVFELKEENLEVYLIGDERLKSKFLKAINMKSKEDAIVYISKKLKLDSEKVLEEYKKGIFYLENYLYKNYYSSFSKYRFKYNGRDERIFDNFIKEQITFLNLRTYLKLYLEDIVNDFENYYINYGDLDINFFKSLEKLSEKDLISKITKELNLDFKNCNSKECFSRIDQIINNLKVKGEEKFSKISFSSPFYIFKYLFSLENNISKLRFLLKGKYLNLDENELNKLLGDKNE